MTTFATSPRWLLIVIMVVVVMAIVSASRRKKWNQRQFDVKVCGNCGASQPPHAGYCRQCGQRV